MSISDLYRIYDYCSKFHLIPITIASIIVVIMVNIIIHFAGYELGMYQLVKNNVKANIETVVQASKQCFPMNPVLAQLTAAQAILEGGLESPTPSALAFRYNNLFGIKGHGNATPSSVSLLTTEYTEGKSKQVYQPFANNTDVLASFQQHAEVLANARYQKVRTSDTFEEAATEIREAGYATDPKYTQELIRVYNEYLKGNM